jgi:hypothetical protein
MTPRQFLDEMVRPNVSDFHRHIGSLRHAFNSIAAVDALAAHIYRWCEVNAPTVIASVADDTAYREELSRDGHFRLVRDIAKAQKHAHLTRGHPRVERTEQVVSRSMRFGTARFGGRYSSAPQVIVDINPRETWYVWNLVHGAVAFLESEMARLGA